jgi:hypothetical protein
MGTATVLPSVYKNVCTYGLIIVITTMPEYLLSVFLWTTENYFEQWKKVKEAKTM